MSKRKPKAAAEAITADMVIGSNGELRPERYDECWDRLEREGLVDAWGGAEYRRIASLYFDGSVRVGPVAVFIFCCSVMPNVELYPLTTRKGGDPLTNDKPTV